MRYLILALLLMAPAHAQRAQPLDGAWAGFRTHECRAGGRLSRERITMQVRQGTATLPALLGDPDLQGQVTPEGAVTWPGFGTFQAGVGQITGDRFEGRQANRSQSCWMTYALRRGEGRRR